MALRFAALFSLGVAGLSGAVVINEVHHSPDPRTLHHEFVEVFNTGPEAVDVSGWSLSGAKAVVPAGTTLGAGQYLVFCEDPTALAATYFPAPGNRVYDFSTVANASAFPGTVLVGQDGWVQPAGGTNVTARNDLDAVPGMVGNNAYNSGGAVYVTRKNNAAFSYAIPANATTLRLSLVGRVNSSATTSLGPGHDANNNGSINAANALGEYGFEFGCTANTWFIRQAAQGVQTASGGIGLNGSGRTWYLELRVDLLANGGDGSGSMYVRQLGDTSNNPVTDVLTPVAALQNINLGIRRMSANGGNSAASAWNGWITRVAAGNLDTLTMEWSTGAAAPVLVPFTGSLDGDGETLSLRDAAGALVDEVSYAAEFPWPVSARGEGPSMQLIHPALDNDLAGSWRASTPTPGARNSNYAENAPPQIRQVTHTPVQPAANEPIAITAKVTDPHGVAAVKLSYQLVAPGSYLPAFLPLSHATLLSTPNAALPVNPAFENLANWTEIELRDDGLSGDGPAGDGVFGASIPGQANRTLVRYRIVATDLPGASVRVPYVDDPSLNFACFVWNGAPAWKAATRSAHPEGAGHVYPAALMNSLPIHTLITRAADLRECYAYESLGDTGLQIPKANTDARSAFNWEGAFVYEGVVYDHIQYRLRQSNDRYSGNGRRSMRFRFNSGNRFQARDENGELVAHKWSSINTGKMARFAAQTDFGLREMMNARLWRLFGVDVPIFYHTHFRVVDGAEEAPTGTNGQFLGDFFGLAMFYEDFDGPFLDNRKLPDGNIYKWKDGVTNALALQQHQGREAVDDGSDFNAIFQELRPERDETWLRTHVDWDQWNRYHAICEAIRHYDLGVQATHLKNRGWYFKPAPGAPLGLLRHIPHDHDATWYVGYHDGLTAGIGVDFPMQAIYGYNGTTEKTAFTLEYRNVLRELRDLMWREETVHDLLDRVVGRIAEFSLADIDRWLGGPAAAGAEGAMPKIEVIPPILKSFAFIQDTVNGAPLSGGRAAYLEQLAADPAIPGTPVIASTSQPGFPVNGLAFQSSAFSPGAGGAFGAMQWRVGEINDPLAPAYDPAAPPAYEITAVWDSGPLSTFQAGTNVPLVLRPGHTYRARVRHRNVSGRWSHWSAPRQFTASAADVSVYQASLVISELMYHPAGNNSDLEFIELLNVGQTTLDLTGVRFTKGIDFDFAGSAITSLAPGARVLVVRDRAAFETAYGPGLPIAGEYRAEDEDNFSDGGERVKLSFGAGQTILDLDYSDDAPWPVAADGGGRSLVLINPSTRPNPSLAKNWRASSTAGGNPGGSDATIFGGSAEADIDRDGTNALLEFALGRSDTVPTDATDLPAVEYVTVGSEIFPALRYPRRLAAGNLRETMEYSTDLVHWTAAPDENWIEAPQGADGRPRVLIRTGRALGSEPRQFLRLKVEVLPATSAL